ncbi:MAG: hypothetical protein JO332_18625 [Planctomycetaceae bacterium]|nr:hypothetical protein [Planctomycetaceae bacterium]
MFNRWKGDRLIEKAHDFWTDSGELARDGATRANSFIHRKPLAAALISVGAGLCFGMIFGGRRRAERPEPRRRLAAAAGRVRRTARR